MVSILGLGGGDRSEWLVEGEDDGRGRRLEDVD